MYTKYFGLTEKPFTIPPNPRYLYMSAPHREALAHLLYGIDSDGCFLVLTGDIGTGKTTISRLLLEQMPEGTDVALILNPKLSTLDLLESICDELGIHIEKQYRSIKLYTDHLNNYLLKSHSQGRNTTLIIDEAQNLSVDVLEQLRLLTNLETNTKKLLRIVLIGQTELQDILNKPELSQLKQRVTSSYHLKPLAFQDAVTYIQHRIAIAGGGRYPLFSPRAIKHIVKTANGIPRLINLLCDRSLLGTYAENSDQVSLKIAQQASREIFANNKNSQIKRKRIYLLLFCLFITIAGSIGLLSYLNINPPTISQQQQTGQQGGEDNSETPFGTKQLKKFFRLLQR